jgi:hypothetical protein
MGNGEWGMGSGEWRTRGTGGGGNMETKNPDLFVSTSPLLPVTSSPCLPVPLPTPHSPLPIDYLPMRNGTFINNGAPPLTFTW